MYYVCHVLHELYIKIWLRMRLVSWDVWRVGHMLLRACDMMTMFCSNELRSIQNTYARTHTPHPTGPTRGGKRPEPTRYGDWERKGRASDF
jgi:hypothetical protein